MTHFYAVSRRDLPTHQQAIQNAHAQVTLTQKRPDLIKGNPPFVWLTVEDKSELFQVITRLISFQIVVSEFHDPDYPGYDPSAIACMLTEEERYLLSDLPLWRCSEPPKNNLFEWLRKL